MLFLSTQDRGDYMNLKTQLIREIEELKENQRLITVERLATGERNEMTFYCSKEKLLEIINNNFDDDLNGQVPGGVLTKINGWGFLNLE